MLLTFSFATIMAKHGKSQHLKSIREKVYRTQFLNIAEPCWILNKDDWLSCGSPLKQRAFIVPPVQDPSQIKLAERNAQPTSKNFQDSISMIPTANCTKAVIVRPISVKSLNQSETKLCTLVCNKKVPAKCKSLVMEIYISLFIHPPIRLSIRVYNVC